MRLLFDGRVTGDARRAAIDWLDRVRARTRGASGPVCVPSSGETTVRVTATASAAATSSSPRLAEPLAGQPGIVAASIGTDGIDGTSGVAGAWGETR